MATQPSMLPTNKMITVGTGVLAPAFVSLWQSYLVPIAPPLGEEPVVAAAALIPGMIIAWLQPDAPNIR